MLIIKIFTGILFIAGLGCFMMAAYYRGKIVAYTEVLNRLNKGE